MLDILLGFIGINLRIDQGLKQKLCVSYHTKFIWGVFDSYLVNKSENQCKLYY